MVLAGVGDLAFYAQLGCPDGPLLGDLCVDLCLPGS